MKLISTAVLVCLALVLRTVQASESGNDVKEALQALQDYIGGWKGNGSTEKDRTLWKESANWSWRFKDKDTWLTVKFPTGKYYKSGEMRYLPAKERYQLTLVDKKDKKAAFEGTLKKGRLVLEHVDPESKETQQIVMNMAGGG